MRAMVLDGGMDPPRLALRSIDDPQPSAHEVLVRARASGVNRADLLQRQGKYNQPALTRGLDCTIAGMEVAGSVSAVGSQVTGITVGDRVMAMCGGSYAELVAIDARLALPVPPDLDWTQAAALPVGTMTAFDALARCARLAPAETVLITAATSAVGLIAIQVARILGAGRVIATTRSVKKAAVLEDSGADAIAVGDGAGLADAIADAAGGCGVDVVIDHVGASAFPALITAMVRGGRYVSVGRLGGQCTELDLNVLARNRLALVGATFRTRSIEQYAEIAAGVRKHVLPAIASGDIRARTADQYPLEAANDALDSLAAPAHAGKVTLAIDALRALDTSEVP